MTERDLFFSNVSCLGSKNSLPPCVIYSYVIIIFVFQASHVWFLFVNTTRLQRHTQCSWVKLETETLFNCLEQKLKFE